MIPVSYQTMSSREIADLTGKLHKNVLVDCDKLNESYGSMFMAEISAVNYKADNGQEYREYLLTKMQTFDLMTGYNTELRIKVNRRWEELERKEQEKKSSIDLSDPNTILKIAQNWKNEYDMRLQAEKTIKKMAPKVELMERVLDTDSKIDIGQAAKILGLKYGRNTLFSELRRMGIFFKGRNEPMQEYIERGYFELKEKFIERSTCPGFIVIKVLVTQKGLEYLSHLLNVTPATKQLRFI